MLWLLHHVIGGYARQHPLRAIVTVIAIAIGVALGYAVHLINASALSEFADAVRQASGEADASIAGPREGFDEEVFARVVRDGVSQPSIEAVNPIIEIDAVLVEPARLAGRTLPVVGIDALRAARLAPHLVGAPDTKTERIELALLDDGLYLSPAALATLQLAVGDTLGVQVGERVQRLRIAGLMPRARAGQVLASIDLGIAQWRLGRLGRLSRIDLQLAPGADIAAITQRLQLPAGVFLVPPDAAAARMSNLSRAYRVNLDVLALVALFTGSFLVYSLQAQGVASRRTQLAFLRVLGITRREVQWLLVAEAGTAGVAGSALGVLAGIGIAAAALQVFGGDLGGGFFSGVVPKLVVEPLPAAGFFALGIVAAVIGGWMPARDAAHDVPAAAMKPGADIVADAKAARARLVPGVVLVLTALLLLVLPPVGGIAVAAYAAIGLLLVAAIQFKPLLAPHVFAPLSRWIDRRWIDRGWNQGRWNQGRWIDRRVARFAAVSSAAAWLAAHRLAAIPRFAALGAAGIVASFALMVAMATMVASFRTSVDAWLTRVLPADVYVRAAPTAGSASSAFFSAPDLVQMSAHAGVERVESSRHLRLLLDPTRAPVTLIARPVDYRGGSAARRLPLTGASIEWRAGQPPPVWVSEAIVELYGARVGSEIVLPLDGRSQKFVVAGVWRDYARQSGAVIVDSADYERLTGDSTRTDAALWLRPGADAVQVISELRAQLRTRTAEFAEPSAIRALSLRIFDRSFAVTYVLEVVAIAIGLIGIAATFSAQTFARTREFGMLRHLGVTRGQILALLAFEGLLVTGLAIALGLAAGLAIAWVLVEIVNPQSFHWTMDLKLPAGLVIGLVIALLVSAALTAVIAGRRAVSREAVWAVREDW